MRWVDITVTMMMIGQLGSMVIIKRVILYNPQIFFFCIRRGNTTRQL